MNEFTYFYLLIIQLKNKLISREFFINEWGLHQNYINRIHLELNKANNNSVETGE